MHIERFLTVGADALSGLVSAALESLNPAHFLLVAILLPLGTYVLSQIGAAIIGLYAQRYWVSVFEDRERNLLSANEKLRMRIIRLLKVNSTLRSQHALLMEELGHAIARADSAESLSADQSKTPEIDFVI